MLKSSSVISIISDSKPSQQFRKFLGLLVETLAVESVSGIVIGGRLQSPDCLKQSLLKMLFPGIF